VIKDFYRGNTVKIPLTFKFNGVPLDITGSTVYFTMKKNLLDTYDEATIKKTFINHSNPELGETEILLLPDDTRIPSGEYAWDITIEFDQYNVVTIKSGKVNVKLGATNV
jgi:hypothetical protein